MTPLNWRAAAHHERRRRRQAEALVETWKEYYRQKDALLSDVLRDQGRPVDWRWGAGVGEGTGADGGVMTTREDLLNNIRAHPEGWASLIARAERGEESAIHAVAALTLAVGNEAFARALVDGANRLIEFVRENEDMIAPARTDEP